ncbi:MAG TPA: glycyl-radical enzyme activating protein [Anaerolineaceae bacterium]|nr:glycyl-radical enzyme activating protein [Anaerolineaceae bacterium]HPN53999.1 glycyl-radical enzyme activating protein [Anaerolineaceae bacterium]
MDSIAARISGDVFDIRRYSLHDGPGIRTTVFLKGCPLDCWWCHNPESQQSQPQASVRENLCVRCGACAEACPETAIEMEEGGLPKTDAARCGLCGQCLKACVTGAREILGSRMTVEQVMAQVERDLPFFEESGGGVTFSGGEPLYQPEFLAALAVECRRRDLHCAVDTSGYAPWEHFLPLLNEASLFLYDLKSLAPEKHLLFTGVPLAPILENLENLARAGQPIIVRVPVVPGVNADREDIRAIAAFCARWPQIQRVDLLPYHAAGLQKYARLDLLYRLKDTLPPSEEWMQTLAEEAHSAGVNVLIGG